VDQDFLAAVQGGPALSARNYPFCAIYQKIIGQYGTYYHKKAKDKVPCRIYSNSLRSIFPGAIGNPGCLRSKA